MTKKINSKIQDIEKWALGAYNNAIKGNKYNALNDARKTGEAICKVVIYKELGDDLGDSFISGEITINAKMPAKPSAPSFAGLTEAICSPKMDTAEHFQDKNLKYYLETLRVKGNKGSHDITNLEDDDISYSEVVYCMIALSKLLQYLFNNYLDTPTPANLTEHIYKKEAHYFIAQQSKLPQFRQQKIKSLENLLDDNYQLLDEWKKKKMFTSDPTESKKCDSEINRLKSLAEESENEYNKLLKL